MQQANIINIITHKYEPQQKYRLGTVSLRVSVVDQKHEMQSSCPDSFYNFQNIEISKVVTFH